MDKLFFTPKLRSSWLVQRLKAPLYRGDPAQPVTIPFSFGGGYVNGGFTKEAAQMLSGIFSFDYMGSAEFEWGIVPSCFNFLATHHDELITGKQIILADQKPVYYICHRDHKDQVPDHLVLLAGKEPQSKERIGLDLHYQTPASKYGLDTVGWLDCSNGFLFFVDHTMYSKCCGLFGIEPKAE